MERGREERERGDVVRVQGRVQVQWLSRRSVVPTKEKQAGSIQSAFGPTGGLQQAADRDDSAGKAGTYQ